MFTPNSEALKSKSRITCPEYSSAARTNKPKVNVLCMSAWPMSSTVTSYRAKIPMMEEVSPGRSSPVILISINSVFEDSIALYPFNTCKTTQKRRKHKGYGRNAGKILPHSPI